MGRAGRNKPRPRARLAPRLSATPAPAADWDRRSMLPIRWKSTAGRSWAASPLVLAAGGVLIATRSRAASIPDFGPASVQL